MRPNINNNQKVTFQSKQNIRWQINDLSCGEMATPYNDNQFDYFQENCPFLLTCQRRFTKMSCLPQTTLSWQHFAQVHKASQIECSKLFFSCSTPRYFPNAQDSALNSQECCAHRTTKLGRIPIRVSLWLSVHGTHILKITGENHRTYFQINSKQIKANKNYTQTKLQSQYSSKSIGMWFSHWTSLTSKSWLRSPLSWSTIFNFDKGKNSISLSSSRSYVYQNSATNFEPAEKICLLFKFYHNQSLGGVHTKFDNHPIKIIHVIYLFPCKVEILTSQKTIKGRIFRLQCILVLIRDTGEMKTVRIFFFFSKNSLFLPKFLRERRWIRWLKQS